MYKIIAFPAVSQANYLCSAINGQSFKIEDCEDCDVLLWDYSATVYVDSCKNCRIFIGPCESSVFLRGCITCKIVVACRQLRLCDCKDIKASVYCCTEPVIETSSNLQFNSFVYEYFELRAQFAAAKLSVWNNRWSEIHNFTEDRGRWKILPLTEMQGCEFVPHNTASIASQPATKSLVPLTVGEAFRDATLSRAVIVFLGPSAQHLAELFYDLVTHKSIVVVRAREFKLQKEWAQTLLPIKQVPTDASSNVIALDLAGENALSTVEEITNNPDVFPNKSAIYISNSETIAKQNAIDIFENWKDIV